MANLHECIDSILPNVRFDLGRDATHDGQPSRLYASRPDEVVTVDELSRMAERGGLDLQNAKRALLISPDELVAEIRDYLSVFLEDYVDPDTDKIGYAFPRIRPGFSETLLASQGNGLGCESSVTALDNFAKAAIHGSALVGAEKLEELLTSWKHGEPIQYRVCAILNGITINESFTPIHGARIEVLPRSTAELPSFLPKMSFGEPNEYLGRTVVAIDCEASPALFRPNSNYRRHDHHRVEARMNCAVDFQIVCQTLSLLTDKLVEVGFYWDDYQDLENVFPSSSSSIRQGSPGGLELQAGAGRRLNRDFDTGVVTLSIDDWAVQELNEPIACDTLQTLAKPNFNSVRTATSRWMKSKRSRDGLVDQFVDLRMALEALYLRDFANESSQEMRFRLALFGAWFLGNDFQHRQRIRKTLRDAYDRASGAIHTGHVDPTPENLMLLIEAQGLCRQGISKLLKQGFPADWGDLVLGATI